MIRPCVSRRLFCQAKKNGFSRPSHTSIDTDMNAANSVEYFIPCWCGYNESVAFVHHVTADAQFVSVGHEGWQVLVDVICRLLPTLLYAPFQMHLLVVGCRLHEKFYCCRRSDRVKRPSSVSRQPSTPTPNFLSELSSDSRRHKCSRQCVGDNHLTAMAWI